MSLHTVGPTCTEEAVLHNDGVRFRKTRLEPGGQGGGLLFACIVYNTYVRQRGAGVDAELFTGQLRCEEEEKQQTQLEN